PNAGIPDNVGAHAVFRETPESLAADLQHFARDLGVAIVGGCCGTTPAHIKHISNAVRAVSPRQRQTSPLGTAVPVSVEELKPSDIKVAPPEE
ncbi:homocysteine S-methyltransferase family protein, partial [Klebsiella pneumoniae]|nr:homocysteine S-methyltransferase family protein [Klebsiella pneumoniae]